MKTTWHEMYQKQMALSDIGMAGQEKISQSKVLVIGAGGLGCPALSYLNAMGVGTLGICDFDIVDRSNLHRQVLYGEKDIGFKKVEIAKNALLAQNPNVIIETYCFKIDATNGEEILKNYDVIVDCSDNFRTKFLIHDLCFHLKKNLVQASIYQYDGNLNVFPFAQNGNGPCLRCLWPIPPEDGCTGNCSDVGVLGVVPGIIGAWQSLEVIKLLIGLESLKMGVNLVVDLLDCSVSKHQWKKRSSCPLCVEQLNVQALNEKYQSHRETYELLIQQALDSPEIIWVDIRDREERKKQPLTTEKISRPISNLEDLKKFKKDSKYILVCRRGIRSKAMVEKLQGEGYFNLFSLWGGIEECL